MQKNKKSKAQGHWIGKNSSTLNWLEKRLWAKNSKIKKNASWNWYAKKVTCKKEIAYFSTSEK